MRRSRWRRGPCPRRRGRSRAARRWAAGRPAAGRRRVPPGPKSCSHQPGGVASRVVGQVVATTPRRGRARRPRCRNDGITLRSSVQHHLGVDPGLGQRVGAHPQQQLLVGLARAVDADVGERRRRAAGPAGRRVPWPGPPGGGRSRSPPAGGGGGRPASVWASLEQLAVGVEHAVHVAHVAGPERRVEDVRVAVVAVVARWRGAGRRRCSGSTARGRP